MIRQLKPVATFSVTKAWKALVLVARSFVLFLRKPKLSISQDDRLPLSPLAIGASLLTLSIAATAIFALLALPIFLMAEAAPGGQLRQVFSRSVVSIVLAVIVLGPLIEEVMFRGWLSGTWRSMFGSALFVALVFGILQLVDGLLPVSATIMQLVLAVIGLIGFKLLSPIDNGKRLPYFELAFPYLYWTQGLLFGVLHFQNVSTDSPFVAVLSTFPLVICAWIWGYARIYLGLGSAVLLHAAYNVPAVAGMLALVMLQSL